MVVSREPPLGHADANDRLVCKYAFHLYYMLLCVSVYARVCARVCICVCVCPSDTQTVI